MAQRRRPERRSSCPINVALETVGDRWSLLIVRDLMFGGPKTYKDLRCSGEGIATNILAGRLESLGESGIIASRRDPEDGRRLIYALTPKGVELAPIVLELSRWGTRFEKGKPPAGILEAWEADREGFMVKLKGRLLPPSAAAPGQRPARAKRSKRSTARSAV